MMDKIIFDINDYIVYDVIIFDINKKEILVK